MRAARCRGPRRTSWRAAKSGSGSGGENGAAFQRLSEPPAGPPRAPSGPARKNKLLHFRARLDFLAARSFSVDRMARMAWSAVLNGPCTRPCLTSADPLASSRSITCRCSWLYWSSSGAGFGTIIMTLQDTLNSSRSPVLMRPGAARFRARPTCFLV